MEKENFIHTSDAETAQKLRKLGFQELESTNNMWTFLNKQSFQFTEVNTEKLKFDNKMCI